jgi:hypothetical protein
MIRSCSFMVRNCSFGYGVVPFQREPCKSGKLFGQGGKMSLPYYPIENKLAVSQAFGKFKPFSLKWL